MPKSTFLDPLTPIPPGQLRRQARQHVRKSLSPLISQTEDVFSRRSDAGQQAVTGFTKALADRLQSIGARTDTAVGEANARQQAINAALGQLSGAHQDQAGQLATQAGSSVGDEGGLSMLQRAAQALGGGLGAQQLSGGLSDATRVNELGLSLSAEANRQPGLAALGGLRSSRLLESQLNTDLADQIGAINAQAPGLIEQVFSSLQGREIEKAIADKGFGFDEKTLEVQQGEARKDRRANARRAKAELEAQAGIDKAAARQQAAQEAKERKTIRRQNRRAAIDDARGNAFNLAADLAKPGVDEELLEFGWGKRDEKTGRVTYQLNYDGSEPDAVKLYQAGTGLGWTADPGLAITRDIERDAMPYGEARQRIKAMVEEFLGKWATPKLTLTLIERAMAAAGFARPEAPPGFVGGVTGETVPPDKPVGNRPPGSGSG